MLPRYVPEIGWSSWLDWLSRAEGGTDDEWSRLRAALSREELPPIHREFDTLRSGLVQYFADLRRHAGGGNILVSAQICRIVPLAIERAGLSVRYADITCAGPTSGAFEFAAAMEKNTVGVLIAPLYGHMQREWSPLLAQLGGRQLILDMAQGLGLTEGVSALMQRADAVGYSFGLGKGLDAGGGVLFTRAYFEEPPALRRSKAGFLDALLKSLALQALVRIGCYGLVASRLDSMYASDQTLPEHGMSAPPDICRLWLARMPKLLGEIALARARAQALAAMASLAADLRDAAVYFDPAASHLRQVIRVRRADRRDALVSRLRSLGVDCAAAGEPLPDVPSAPGRFPNAAAFRADAVRLPFLGRLTSRQFEAFKTILEKAVAESLH